VPAALRPPAGTIAQRLRVLLVEDNPADADLVTGYLTAPDSSLSGASVVRVERLGRALGTLASERIDVVLLDLSLPDADRLDGVEAVVAAAPEVPIVVMTGLADDEVALAAVKAGAQDYLIKGEDGPRVVRRAIRYALERQELLARERAARASAEHAARARDEVLGIVSHDLRAPLSTITMCAHALREPHADCAELAEMIAQSADWSHRIIRDLLDVTAIEAGRLTIHPEPMSPGAVVDTVRSMFAPIAAGQGIELAAEPDTAPRWVDVDVDRLVQALGNLVANAIKFTPRGGRVTISAATGPDGTALFRVADTGPGIAPEHLPHLFDRFWQARETRRAGAGLGLAIAKGIVEAHRGSIGVESAVGTGTAFTCVIPTAASAGA
jgi:signal transduction histidine kinase